ncbi:MAG: DUF2357 domain-containing protein [Planctomycetota bacterium]
MTSSNCFEIRIEQRDRNAASLRIERHHLPARLGYPQSVAADRAPRLHVVVPSGFSGLRLLLGADLVGVVREDVSPLRVDLTDRLRDSWGEAVLSATMPNEEDETPDLLFEVLIPLDASPQLDKLYEHLIAELESVHLGLARDILGTSSRLAERVQPRVFEPTIEAKELEAIYERMRLALLPIRKQPSSEVTREPKRVRWRPGDRLDGRATRDLVRQVDLEWRGRRPQRIGHLVVQRPTLSFDIPEHRHLRAGLERLAGRAERLVEGCERAIDLISAEKVNWGAETTSMASVYDQRFRPRVEKLQRIADSGRELARRYRWLIESNEFIRTAGKPRRKLAPTPLFVRRAGYREVYRLLQETRRSSGVLLDDQEVRIHFRSLDLLYEYWCFITVVRDLKTMLGPPLEGSGFLVVDEIYRPELKPGQRFTWQRDSMRVEAYYEPSIPPAASPSKGPRGWRSALVGAPLRPDVLVIREGPDGVRALVLDAKNTSRYGWKRLFEASDYRTLVYDPGNGRQPIRQAVFLHRDEQGFHCTTPNYFEESGALPPELFSLASVPLRPEQTEPLEHVLRRFLA